MDAKLRDRILWRDGGCIARYVNNPLWSSRFPMLQGLPDPGPCRNAAGDLADALSVANLTIEEIKIDAPGEPGSHLRIGKKAGYSLESSVAVCWGHHVFGRGPGAQWCTRAVVRDAIRVYLPAANR